MAALAVGLGAGDAGAVDGLAAGEVAGRLVGDVAGRAVADRVDVGEAVGWLAVSPAVSPVGASVPGAPLPAVKTWRAAVQVDGRADVDDVEQVLRVSARHADAAVAGRAGRDAVRAVDGPAPVEVLRVVERAEVGLALTDDAALDLVVADRRQGAGGAAVLLLVGAPLPELTGRMRATAPPLTTYRTCLVRSTSTRLAGRGALEHRASGRSSALSVAGRRRRRHRGRCTFWKAITALRSAGPAAVDGADVVASAP